MEKRQSDQSSILPINIGEAAAVQKQRRCHNSCGSRKDRQPFYRLCIVVVSLLAIWKLASLFPTHFIPSTLDDLRNETVSSSGGPDLQAQDRKVDLEVHIMSKCPDAKACLQELVVPAMEKLDEIVNFQLSFIGSVDPDSDSVTCMHGPQECLGNMILLCASQLYPEPRLSLGFANCLINEYPEIPERGLVEFCAKEHGMDFKKINGCISEEGHATELLRDSVQRSTDAKVRTSCTIRLEQQTWCVTDAEKDCNNSENLDALLDDIQTIHGKLNP